MDQGLVQQKKQPEAVDSMTSIKNKMYTTGGLAKATR